MKYTSYRIGDRLSRPNLLLTSAPPRIDAICRPGRLGEVSYLSGRSIILDQLARLKEGNDTKHEIRRESFLGRRHHCFPSHHHFCRCHHILASLFSRRWP